MTNHAMQEKVFLDLENELAPKANDVGNQGELHSSPLKHRLNKKGEFLPLKLKMFLIDRYIGREVYLHVSYETRYDLIIKAMREYKKLIKHNFKSVHQYKNYLARKRGFASYDQMYKDAEWGRHHPWSKARYYFRKLTDEQKARFIEWGMGVK